jgi:hypothetical protein
MYAEKKPEECAEKKPKKEYAEKKEKVLLISHIFVCVCFGKHDYIHVLNCSFVSAGQLIQPVFTYESCPGLQGDD